MTLATDISLVVSSLLTQEGFAGSMIKAPIDFSLLRKLETDEADLLWYQTEVLAASASTVLDLDSGLVDVLGNALTFDKIKILAVVAGQSNTADILVGGGNFASFLGGGTDRISVQPGGACFLVAPNTGYQVTPATGDELEIGNDSIVDANSYSIFLVGKS
jgi:hypothetical protein